jgi:hypothetical protein
MVLFNDQVALESDTSALIAAKPLFVFTLKKLVAFPFVSVIAEWGVTFPRVGSLSTAKFTVAPSTKPEKPGVVFDTITVIVDCSPLPAVTYLLSLVMFTESGIPTAATVPTRNNKQMIIKVVAFALMITT